MITDKELADKIDQVEELMKAPINLLNFDFHEKLFSIHNHLWNLRYFKMHQEKGYLDEEESIGGEK